MIGCARKYENAGCGIIRVQLSSAKDRNEDKIETNLRFELEIRRCGPQQHLANLDPILGVEATHEAL